MTMSAKLRRTPTRLVTGAFILNSGLGKLHVDDDTAKVLHSMASGAFPVFEKLDPKMFGRVLAAGEIALGAALLAPVVPAAVAGAGLAAFSGGLLAMYWRTPALHGPNDPRPTPDGIAIAKDSWMFGIGTGLVIDAVTSSAHDKRVELTHAVTSQANAVGAHAKEAVAVNTVKAAALSKAAKGASRRAVKKAQAKAGR